MYATYIHRMNKDFMNMFKVIQLWSMTDRVVRTSLLDALKNMAPVIPASAVNKHIFENMVAGFSDSNAK